MNHFLLAAVLAVATTVGVVAGQGQSHATFLQVSDPQFGINSITVDTDTGLRWLNVSLSANRTYNDVAGQFGVGGDSRAFGMRVLQRLLVCSMYSG